MNARSAITAAALAASLAGALATAAKAGPAPAQPGADNATASRLQARTTAPPALARRVPAPPPSTTIQGTGNMSPKAHAKP